MSKHTPGPWLFHAPSAVSFTQVECAGGTRQGRLAASIFHPENPGRPMIRVGATTDDPIEVIANARLIAAAPALLEALKLFVRAEKMARDGNPPQDADKLIELGDAAIAKAEGQP